MIYVTIKLWGETRRLLRLIAADTGEQMVEVMDRLCREEIKRLGLSVAPSVADAPRNDDAAASQSDR